jgi:hypothetical protein
MSMTCYDTTPGTNTTTACHLDHPYQPSANNASASQCRPTKATKDPRRPTKANAGQQRTHKGQRWPTLANVNASKAHHHCTPPVTHHNPRTANAGQHRLNTTRGGQQRTHEGQRWDRLQHDDAAWQAWPKQRNTLFWVRYDFSLCLFFLLLMFYLY